MYAEWTESDKKAYIEAQNEYKKYSKKIDDVLYEMCKKWPKHNDRADIHAKVTIIGRTYAAGLERLGGKDSRKGIIRTVTDIFYKNRYQIDLKLSKLKIHKTLSTTAVNQISEVHEYFMSILRDNTTSKVNFRSFVSKYLHFHFPVVPIFDSIAVKTLSGEDWYPAMKCPKRKYIQQMENIDKGYYRFLRQFQCYFSDLKELKLNPTVRSADYYLRWEAS